MHIAPNNKKYIGITSQAVTERWKNGRGYTHNAHFFNAIKKYNWNNFQHMVLFSNLTEQVAARLEQICIILFKSYDPKFGYNKTFGGEHPIYAPNFIIKNSRKVYCLETDTIYDSIAAAQRAFHFSTYTGILEMCNGKYKHVHGYHFCDVDNIDKLKQTYQNKINTDDKRVYCFTDKTLYDSTFVAAKMTNTPLRTIQRRCANNNREKTKTGFSFCYYYNLREDEKNDIITRQNI